jgi:hypothetical protein
MKKMSVSVNNDFFTEAGVTEMFTERAQSSDNCAVALSNWSNLDGHFRRKRLDEEKRVFYTTVDDTIKAMRFEKHIEAGAQMLAGRIAQKVAQMAPQVLTTVSLELLVPAVCAKLVERTTGCGAVTIQDFNYARYDCDKFLFTVVLNMGCVNIEGNSEKYVFFKHCYSADHDGGAVGVASAQSFTSPGMSYTLDAFHGVSAANNTTAAASDAAVAVEDSVSRSLNMEDMD